MKKWMYWLLPLFWMGVIFYSSAQPYENQNLKPFFSKYFDFSFLKPIFNPIKFTYHNSEVSVDALGINGFVEFFIRKGAHFTVYFILVLLFIVAFRKTIAIKRSSIVMISLVLTVIYAVSDEVHQGFTSNRTPYIGDVVIDTVGAVFGVVFYAIILKFRKS